MYPNYLKLVSSLISFTQSVYKIEMIITIKLTQFIQLLINVKLHNDHENLQY